LSLLIFLLFFYLLPAVAGVCAGGFAAGLPPATILLHRSFTLTLFYCPVLSPLFYSLILYVLLVKKDATTAEKEAKTNRCDKLPLFT
jgi:type II secretory pathway component PulF